MMRRFAVFVFLAMFLAAPSEAGLFGRKKPRVPKQAKAAKYGMTREARQKQIEKGRRNRKVKRFKTVRASRG